MTDIAPTPDLGAQATNGAGATEPTLVQKLAAEALGTFVLVFIGCGSAVMLAANDDLGFAGVVSIGLSFGIAVVMMAYAVGRISGGHFNPAVSLGAALSGRLSWKDFGLYSGAQIVGGLIGGLLLALTALASDIWEFGDPLGSNGFGDQGGVELFGALLLELLLTFIFLIVILGVTDERNDNANFAPLAIGLSLAAIHFVAIPATGTSVNPARSIAVAFFSGSDAIIQLWLFIVAPLLGAALAGVLYPLIFGRGAGDANIFASFGKKAPQQGFAAGYQQQWDDQSSQSGQAGQAGGYGQHSSYGHNDGFGQPGQSAPAGDAAAAQTAYAAPQSDQPSHSTGAHAAQPAQEQPIIQDGWQWDPESQQWIPAQQPPASGGETVVRPQDGQ